MLNSVSEIAESTCPIDWISMEEVGDVVANIFSSSDEYLHQNIYLKADRTSVAEIVPILSEHLQPFSFLDKEVGARQGWPHLDKFVCRDAHSHGGVVFEQKTEWIRSS